METWWPATHHIGKTPFEAIFVEPRVGGRWYERDVQGNQCDWGTVLAWEPPNRVTFSWHLGPGHDQPDWKATRTWRRRAKWRFDSRRKDQGTTLVELTHSKLERHGEGYEQLRTLFDGPGAWGDILPGARPDA
jgi:hypothetical protein